MTRRKSFRLSLPAELVKYPNQEAWEAARNADPKRIGGSDIANLWGVGYGTPLGLWQEIQRRRRGDPPAEIEPGLADRFALGHYLEPYVRAQAARELGQPVLSPKDFGAEYHQLLPEDDPIWGSPVVREHVAVTLDAVTLDPETGRAIPVELKTVDVAAAGGWPLDRPHPAAALQAATQAVVMRSGYAYVYAMIGYGTGPQQRRLYRVNVPDGFVDELSRRLVEFFGAVEAGEPPELRPEDNERISRMFPAATPGKVIYLPPGLGRAILQREEAKSQIAVLEKQVDAAEAEIKMALKDAETGILQGTDVAVTYPTVTKIEKPRLGPKVVTYRRLSVRQVRKDELQRAIPPGEEDHGRADTGVSEAPGDSGSPE